MHSHIWEGEEVCAKAHDRMAKRTAKAVTFMVQRWKYPSRKILKLLSLLGRRWSARF